MLRKYLSLTVIVILFCVDPSDRTKKLCHTSLLICFVKLPLLSLVQVLQWRELQRWGWRRWTSPKIGQLCTLDMCSKKSSGISRNLFGIASDLMGSQGISWYLTRSHQISWDLKRSYYNVDFADKVDIADNFDIVLWHCWDNLNTLISLGDGWQVLAHLKREKE